MMAENQGKRTNRSLKPEVISDNDELADKCDKREVIGNVGAVAGILTALSSEVWRDILPEVDRQAIFAGGVAVVVGGLWQMSRAVRLREYAERESDLLRKVVDNLPLLAGSVKDGAIQLYDLYAELAQKQLAYELAVKTGDKSVQPLTTDKAVRHAALVRLTDHRDGVSLVNGAAAQVLGWVGCALPPEMTVTGQRRNRRGGQIEAEVVHQETLDLLDQCVPLDEMTWREYVASPEFAAVCGSARQIDRGLRLQAKSLRRQPTSCFSSFAQYRPREENW